MKSVIERLKQMSNELAATGSSHGIEVIEEIWEDGGGDPIFLSDVIDVLEEYIKKLDGV